MEVKKRGKVKSVKKKLLAYSLYIIFFSSVILAVGYYYKYYRNRGASEAILKEMEHDVEEQQVELRQNAREQIEKSKKADGKTENTAKKVKKTTQNDTTEKTSAKKTKRSGLTFLDMTRLQKINRDIYGWIDIPDTNINYPVLHHKQNDYYLMHNVNHSTGYPGCIYSDAQNSLDFADEMTVLYGHNMKNETMFGSLYHYREKEYLDKHPYIYIYTERDVKVYEIMMVTEWNQHNIFSQFSPIGKEDKANFLKKASKNSIQCREYEKYQDEQLLILSTCVYNKKEKRFLVIARSI